MTKNALTPLPQPKRPLLLQRRFGPLFILFQTGTFNDFALKNAMIALVLSGGITLFSPNIPSQSIIPLAAGLYTGPFLLLSAIAGQLADKIDRGKILKRIKRVEIAIMLLASLGFFLNNAFILALSLSLMGAQSAFFTPTKNAVLPQWMNDDELIKANSLMSGFQFFTILLGTLFGTIIFKAAPDNAPLVLACTLLGLALIGWIASEAVPPAAPPNPKLRVNYNPVTAILFVLKRAWAVRPVFRPMLGIAWFYGFSTILITALPNYVKNIMGYDLYVLGLIQACSTIGILSGALLCMALTKKRESHTMVAVGIIGITIFAFDLYFGQHQSSVAGVILGPKEFLSQGKNLRFLFDIVAASCAAGLFVIPLQAMSQGRAPSAERAQLMSAGAVMLNLSVNFFTLALFGLGYLTLSPNTPFLLIAIVSALVSVYAIFRIIRTRQDAL